MEKQFVLITGATGCLGGAFVRQSAMDGENLILLGRSQEKLDKLKAEIAEKYPEIDVLVYAVDLSKEDSRDAFFAQLTPLNVKIKRLINVAGVDTQKAFEKYTQEKAVFQARVNLEAPVSLCLFALENRAESLEIINVSSISGSCPMPYFNLYSATKSALTYFSLSLREEVKKKGVKVTAVTPGGIPTRDDIKEQIKGQGLWGKLTAKSPEFVVKKAIKGVKKNKPIVIPGFFNKVMNVLTKILPRSLKLKFIAYRWSKIEKDAF